MAVTSLGEEPENYLGLLELACVLFWGC